MKNGPTIAGEMRQGSVPDWKPLEETFLSDDICDYFMWMFDVELEDGRIINAYKHYDTRRYIHLGSDLRAYWYVGEQGYVEVDPHQAISCVFNDRAIEEMTEDENADVLAAMRRGAARYDERHPELNEPPAAKTPSRRRRQQRKRPTPSEGTS